MAGRSLPQVPVWLPLEPSSVVKRGCGEIPHGRKALERPAPGLGCTPALGTRPSLGAHLGNAHFGGDGGLVVSPVAYFIFWYIST